MADGLKIKITNISNLVWTRNNWGVGAGQSDELNWTDELTQTPSQQLEKLHGVTEAAADQAWLTGIVRDALYIRLGYGSTDGNFAIVVQQRFHMVTIGPGDQWSVWDQKWIDRGTDSSAYTWTFPNCKIVATPTLTNTSAFVDVLITPI